MYGYSYFLINNFKLSQYQLQKQCMKSLIVQSRKENSYFKTWSRGECCVLKCMFLCSIAKEKWVSVMPSNFKARCIWRSNVLMEADRTHLPLWHCAGSKYSFKFWLKLFSLNSIIILLLHYSREFSIKERKNWHVVCMYTLYTEYIYLIYTCFILNIIYAGILNILSILSLSFIFLYFCLEDSWTLILFISINGSSSHNNT